MRYLTILAIVITSLAAAACVSSRPVHYYTLQPAPLTVNPAKADGLILLMGAITTPELLQDGRIRYRTGANESSGYEFHRWMERPGMIVRESLLRALAASGRYQRVLDAGSGVSGDYLVRGKLSEFGEVDDPASKTAITTRISLRVELVERKTNRSVWDGLAEHEEPASGKTMNDVVQSMERNLHQVVNQAAADIDRFLASRRPS
jgi:ABC-type uncharacterized transport system auxiliary subunit